jgi:hypothetical protein
LSQGFADDINSQVPTKSKYRYKAVLAHGPEPFKTKIAAKIPAILVNKTKGKMTDLSMNTRNIYFKKYKGKTNSMVRNAIKLV